MAAPELEKWIRENYRRGFTPRQLKDKLVESGYDPSIVDDVLLHADPGTPPRHGSEQPRRSAAGEPRPQQGEPQRVEITVRTEPDNSRGGGFETREGVGGEFDTGERFDDFESGEFDDDFDTGVDDDVFSGTEMEQEFSNGFGRSKREKVLDVFKNVFQFAAKLFHWVTWPFRFAFTHWKWTIALAFVGLLAWFVFGGGLQLVVGFMQNGLAQLTGAEQVARP